MSKTNGVEISKGIASAIASKYSKGVAELKKSGAFLLEVCKLVRADAKGKPITTESIKSLTERMEPEDKFARSKLAAVLKTYTILPDAVRKWAADGGSQSYHAITGVATSLLATRDKKSGAFVIAAALKHAANKKSGGGAGKAATKPSREGSMASAAIHLKSMRSLKYMPKEFKADVAKLAKKYGIVL